MRHVAAWRVTSGSAVLALGTVIGGTTEAAGPVYTVNSTADVPDAVIDGICGTGGTCNGVPCCTLRAAIMEANFDFSGQEVTINLPAGTYKLLIPIGVDNQSDGDLDLYGKVRIVGAGYDLSIIDANHVDRAIFVSSSAVVTLSDLRVQGGRPPNADRPGYGAGGGIYNDGGDLTLVRCLVRDNVADSGYPGGGIYSYGGSLTLTDTILRINTANDASGGGYGAYQAATTISRSAIYSNTANTSSGGGVFQSGGSLTVTNSTISGNVAGEGGGMYLWNLTGAKLNNVTVAGNDTDYHPAGADASLLQSSVILSNSIFGLYDATNAAASGDVRCVGDIAGITSNGFNTIWDSGDCAIAGPLLNILPDLYPLAFNGGITPTLAAHTRTPSVFSYSVDAGDPAGCLDPLGAPLATDQRGVKRNIGSACDLGAFEVEPIGDANGDGVVDVGDVFYLINFLFAGGPVPKGRANVDGAAGIDVADVFYLVNFLFAGGQPPV